MTATLADIGTRQYDDSKNKIQQMFMACDSRYQNYSGGFGSGKTTACCKKVQVLSYAMPNNLFVVCRKTYPDLRDTTRKAFFEILPKSWYKGWKESENALTIKTLNTKHNSVILFRHFENGKIKVGSSLGGFFIDQAEEADEEIFKGLLGRLRRPVPRRYGILAMNPNGYDWQHRLFVKAKNPDFAHFDSTTFDNEANLPENYINDMLATFPAEWIERYVYGKWSKMSGLIYHEFDEDRHLCEPFEIPKDWVRGRGLDWGVDAPATAVFVAQSPDGHFYVFDEYGERERTPEEHADSILGQSREYGSFRGNVLDASAFRRDQDLKSVADRYRSKGLMCWPATKDQLASILWVKHLLKTNMIHFFRGRTENTIEEMKCWKWGSKQSGKEVPARGNDHYLDAKRYVLDWMYKKKFYSAGTPATVKEKPTAKLSFVRQVSGDPITGMPA